MDDKMLVNFQRQQIRALQEEKAAALEALDLAEDLGHFSAVTGQMPSREELLREICLRANKMIPFQSAGIYLVDDETHDFVQALSSPKNAGGIIEKEVKGLIADQSFAFALQSDTSVFFLDSTKSNHLLLHPLSTPFRIRGMFVGLMYQNKEEILDTTLKLFSVVMLSAVHALENLENHLFIKNHNKELERKVRLRTQELVDAYERINVTLNGMQAGVLVVEAATHVIVDANPMALKMLGASWDEVVGKVCFDLICSARRGACPIMDKGLEGNSGECLIERHDGKVIPVHKTVSKVMIGGKLHLVENFIDITEQKNLADLKEDVDRIMRHDLKSPLNGIINLPDIILMDGDGLNENQRELLGYIKSSGYKLLNMINSSLDLYKMETRVYKYHPKKNNLLSIVRSVLNDLSEQIEQKKLEILFLLDGKSIDIDCNLMLLCEEFLVYSLFSNLFKNAVEASPKEKQISFEVLRDHDTTVITIRNQGVVPEGIRESFFEKYVTEGKSGGTGLGTYSARLITETMGGSISVSSSEGSGTAISIKLPVLVEVDSGS
ncbi:ATP-binding protein [Maridesulfovibrio hydrothermalis]|uniref:histidine kinase n=1 Tax=Maridesulfovibrio hydrothermalis AM13 = DSM 14728 TaxID=1121451 RepID=L0R9S3_9BACT|nr:ATP-binding protein [Maridesulfovibrio hydrothermalis]CCO23499.1 PAS/PAC sensor signal transduction histidine kinase [Maridesulfovibrio hydrothermalis AM13 = DSM 14728]